MTSDPFPSPEAIRAAADPCSCRYTGGMDEAGPAGATYSVPCEHRGVLSKAEAIIRRAVKAQPVVALPPCPTCGGAGHRIRPEDMHFAEPVSHSCPSCKGSGVDRLIPESEIREWIANYREHPPVDTRDSKTAGWTLDDLTGWLDEREARQ